ncbi:MAG: phosphotransferase [Verrucomicrobia bacterium]|nr:phosphotransferase [Verrucomicrobiota bacterium]
MPANTLLTAIRAHLKLHPTHTVVIEPIQSGASGRTILRLRPDGHPTFIGLHYTNERPDNALFLPIAHFLKDAGLNVPAVLYDNRARNLALVEDLGGDDLLSLKDAPWAEREPYYRSVFQQLEKLMYLKVPKDLELMPPFTEDSYLWEQNYFIDHFVEEHLGLNGNSLREDPQLASLRKRLGAVQRGLVHRDLQSQNILLHDGQAWLIDFQGMRLGHQEYDLASLLYDPYMDHSEEDIERLLALWEEVADERPIDALLRDCAAQRLMQALGAFANIVHNYHNDWYKQHIPTAVRTLRRLTTDSPLESPLAESLGKAALA